MLKQIRLAVLAVSLSSCAISFERPATDADYGNPPSDYKEQIEAQMQDVLYDPFSAIFEYDAPAMAYLNKGLARGGKIDCYGWVIDFRLNAKNRLGGYAGWSYYSAFFCEGRRPWIFDKAKGKQPALHRLKS